MVGATPPGEDEVLLADTLRESPKPDTLATIAFSCDLPGIVFFY